MKTQAIRRQEFTVTANKTLILKIILIAAFSFLISRSKILNSMSPFGASLTAVMPFKYSWITFLGSMLGYGVQGFTQNNLLYMAVMMVVMAWKVLFRKSKIGTSVYIHSLITLLSYLAVILTANYFLNFTGVDLALRICEGVIACGVTCFAHLAINALLEQNSLKRYNTVELSSCMILLMLAVMGFMEFRLGGLEIGMIFASAALFCAVYQLGASGGALAGVVLAIALSLYSTEYITISAVLVVSALISGIFQPLGKFPQTAVFLSVALFSVFIIGIDLKMLYYLMDMILGAGIFLMIPRKYYRLLELAGSNVENEQSMKENIEYRLHFAANAITDLQDSLTQVSQKLNEMNAGEVNSVYHKTVNCVCKSCGMNLLCWDENYNDTMDFFQKMTITARQKGGLSSSDFQGDTAFSCCKQEQLMNQFNHYYREFQLAENAKKRLSEVRSLAVEQLAGVSQMLWEVSSEISEMRENDSESARIIFDVFSELAAPPTEVFCTYNQYERMEIDIYTLSNVEFDKEELCKAISHSLEREFALPSVSKIKNKVRVSFCEKANYEIDFGVCQSASGKQHIPMQKGETCGDSYEFFTDHKGYAYLILSDGMGTGKRAALDSAMTCSILLKLIKAGFGLDSVIKFVNSSLQVKSTEESLSTIDIARIDLYTGQVEFYKAGSAASFVKLDQAVGKVETSSLPVGILTGIEFDKQSYLLHTDDLVVLVSDGVLCGEETRLKQLIMRNHQLPAAELAQQICQTAGKMCGEHPDDMTVMVAKMGVGV